MNPAANGSSGPVTRTRDGSPIRTLLSIVEQRASSTDERRVMPISQAAKARICSRFSPDVGITGRSA
jgi:hypothetical protein